MMYAYPVGDIDIKHFNQPELDKMKLNRPYRLIEDEERIKSINQYLTKDIMKCKVLDIGCGAGTFLELCYNLGIDYCGIEPNIALYNYCVKHFPLLEKKLFNSTLKETSLELNNFDLIILNHILEHVENPLEFLVLCKDYLREGGAIYVEVPNETFVLTKVKLKKLLGVYSGVPTNIEHRSLFTSVTLKRIITKVGFKRYIGWQKSLWGNMNAIKIALGDRPIPSMIKIAIVFFRLTKFDLIMKQGLLVGVAFK